MAPPRPAPSPYPLWPLTSSWASQQVVGTHAYIPNILEMLGAAFAPDGSTIDRTVELVPEPQNPYGQNAIAARFFGKTVGYLPREDAVRYHRPLADLVALGFLPIARARVWAREYTDWDDLDRPRKALSVNISLHLADQDNIVPLNDPPQCPYTLLPEGVLCVC